MNQDSPSVIVLGGPNGAGKSTLSGNLFSNWPGKIHFVNADTIARGLSALHYEDMAFEAGRFMLDHLKKLAQQRADIAFVWDNTFPELPTLIAEGGGKILQVHQKKKWEQILAYGGTKS